MKKLLTLLLALLMLLSVFAACTTVGNEPNQSNSGTTQAPTNSTGDPNQPPAQKPPYELPERDFDGDVFNILVPPGKIWQFESHSVNPEVLNEVIMERNMEVEFGYHAVVEPIYKGNSNLEYNQLIHQELNAQTGDYDAVYYPTSYGMIGYINQSRYFCNLLDNQYIDMDCDWWLKDFNKLLVMDNKLYGVNGYGVVESMSGTTAVFFNKTMYNSLFSETGDYTDLYKMVDAGKWTLDQMQAMAEVAKDDKGNGSMGDEDDVYGVVSNSISYVLLYGMNSNYIAKNGESEYALNFNEEHNLNVFEKLYRFCNKDFYLNMTDWLAPNTVFGDGRALFQITAFDQAYRIKNTGVDYGILPLPKYDEAQTRYYGVNNATGCFAIPTTCDSVEFSSIMLNAWNYYSYQIIYPEYKESFYKYNIAGESEDSTMIDLIFNSWTPEFTHVYSVSFSNPAGKIYNMILQKNTGYTSFYRENQEIWQDQLDIILGKKQAAPSPFD